MRRFMRVQGPIARTRAGLDGTLAAAPEASSLALARSLHPVLSDSDKQFERPSQCQAQASGAAASVHHPARCALSACSSHNRRTWSSPQCEPLSVARPVTITVEAPSAATFDSWRSRAECHRGHHRRRARENPSRSLWRRHVRTRGESRRANQVRGRSTRSPDIVGEACLSVVQLPESDAARLRAERAFAKAGARLYAGDVQGSFDDYLAAARDFDSFDRLRAAQSRHAMAELA